MNKGFDDCFLDTLVCHFFGKSGLLCSIQRLGHASLLFWGEPQSGSFFQISSHAGGRLST